MTVIKKGRRNQKALWKYKCLYTGLEFTWHGSRKTFKYNKPTGFYSIVEDEKVTARKTRICRALTMIYKERKTEWVKVRKVFYFAVEAYKLPQNLRTSALDLCYSIVGAHDVCLYVFTHKILFTPALCVCFCSYT